MRTPQGFGKVGLPTKVPEPNDRSRVEHIEDIGDHGQISHADWKLLLAPKVEAILRIHLARTDRLARYVYEWLGQELWEIGLEDADDRSAKRIDAEASEVICPWVPAEPLEVPAQHDPYFAS